MKNRFTVDELLAKGFRLVDELTHVYLEYIFNPKDYMNSKYLLTNDVLPEQIQEEVFIVDEELTELELDYLIKTHTV